MTWSLLYRILWPLWYTSKLVLIVRSGKVTIYLSFDHRIVYILSTTESVRLIPNNYQSFDQSFAPKKEKHHPHIS